MHAYQRAYGRRDEGGLSVLAQGTGLLDGGVEVECYPDFRHSLSLSGKAFLKPSASSSGRSVKPQRGHLLALPKTYVTRRGEMMLFTAPEDMIIGTACQVHQKQVRQKQLSYCAAAKLGTTSTLLDSALSYETEKEYTATEDEGENAVPQPGHFTKVYLETLRKANERADELADDVAIEDIEIEASVKDGGLSECDSGLGTSGYSHPSGRISSLSQHSDTATLVVPDGVSGSRSPLQVRFDENVMIEGSMDRLNNVAAQLRATSAMSSEGGEARDRSMADDLTGIIFDLGTKAYVDNLSTFGAKRTKAGVRGKKKSSKVDKSKETQLQQSEKQCISSEKVSSDGAKRKSKSKKKSKKARKSSGLEDGQEMSERIHREGDAAIADEVSSVTGSEEDGGEDGKGTKASRRANMAERKRLIQLKAEERRKEIERKRLEKHQMEMKKAEEEERKRQLLLRLAAKEEQDGGLDEKADSMLELDRFTGFSQKSQLDLANEMASESDEDVTKVTPDNSGFERLLSISEARAQEAIQKAKEMRARLRLEEEERRRQIEEMEKEERERKRREEEERLKRERASKEHFMNQTAKETKTKEKLHYMMRLEAEKQKCSQRIGPINTFSYFRYLPQKPPPKKDKRRNIRRPRT